MQKVMEEGYILSCFKELFRLSPEEVDRIGDDIPIPMFNVNDLEILIENAKKVFTVRPIVGRCTGEYIIVGDIHGNFHDLMRIFLEHGLPGLTKYIFLGDYVDRGCYSLECILLLLTFTVVSPGSIFMLRGNHEFKAINSKYGFKEQLDARYPESTLFEQFNDLFNYMPIACILNNTIFLVHAGIPDESFDISKIEKLQRPIIKFDNPLVAELVWSDPALNANCGGNENYRGIGHFFSKNSLKHFLINNNFTVMIRSHQCVNGIQKEWGDSLITVFSSSGYDKNEAANCGGIVHVYSDGTIKMAAYEDIDEPEAVSAFYYRVNRLKKIPATSLSATQREIPMAILSSSKPLINHRKSSFFPRISKGTYFIMSKPNKSTVIYS